MRQLLAIAALLLAGSDLALAQTTAFTYQGQLADGGVAAHGSYDLTFSLYDAGTSGGQVGGSLTRGATTVSNGLFTITLDFGSGIFTGDARWLEIGVRTNGGGAFTTLTPRQPLTPSPYALYAPSAGTAASATSATSAGAVGVNGVANGSLQAGAVTSDKIADGTIAAGDLNAASFNTTFWRATGNAGTTPGTHFLGTSDNQALELRVNGQRALRVEPDTLSPVIVGGHASNQATAPGAVVVGGGTEGGPNRVQGLFSTIAGGAGNTIDGVQSSFIGGGAWNTIRAFSGLSAIGGGSDNVIGTNTFNAVISGGFLNLIGDFAGAATVGGGSGNSVHSYAAAATVAGGSTNTIQEFCDQATIAGGRQNTIRTNADYATIGGGYANLASDRNATVAGGSHNAATGRSAVVAGGEHNQATTNNTTVVGGYGNTASGLGAFVGGGGFQSGFGAAMGNTASGRLSVVSGGSGNEATGKWATVGGGENNVASGEDATVPGGALNVAGGAFSFAAGYRARADHTGAFVWADSTDADFASMINNQFLIRASNGVGINTPSPSAALDVASGDAVVRGTGNFVPGTDARLSLGDGNNYIRAVWGEGLRLGVWQGADALVVNNGGTVGIGTNNPQARLHITAAGGQPQLRLDQTAVGDYARLRFQSAGTNATWDLAVGGWADVINFWNTYRGNVMTLDRVGNLTIAGAYSPSSDRNSKENFTLVDSQEVLEKVAALPISRWKFKQDPDAEHLGPMAQDFHAAFGLGTDDRHIATVDADGVALAAIQGLNHRVDLRNQKSEVRIQKLEQENAELKREITAQMAERRTRDQEMTTVRDRLERLERLLLPLAEARARAD